MKRKGLYVLATVALLALAAGCGSDEVKNTDNQVTEAVLPTEVPETPESTATPEPTATPTPTATPVPTNYMEANGIEVLGAGQYTCKGIVVTGWDENGEEIAGNADVEYSFEVTETDNADGTKTICGTINQVPYVNEGGGWSAWSMGGFVDLQTGKSFLPTVGNVAQVTLLKQEENEYELQLAVERIYPSATYPCYTERYTLVCPSEYEDAGFFITGLDVNGDWEAYTERKGFWKKLNFIRHGESDMLVFGVNKGLATEPVTKMADGEELAEENYFEVNGLTTRGEGRVRYLGTELFQKRNHETGLWETVTVETKEVEVGFSVTEESLGDGTKQIRGTFRYDDEGSENEYRGTSSKAGVMDKQTGLIYPTQTYNLANSYVLEKDGEQFSILVGKEYAEEAEGENVCIEVTISVICPEEYDDFVFYLTGNYMTEEADYTKKAEAFSIRDLEHGESDLVFLR